MGRVAAPLRQMGARIVSGEQERPPLEIQGGRLQAIAYTMPVASAQVKSAVLFAGLFAQGETSVEEPYRTLHHSELALRAFGIELTRRRAHTTFGGGQKRSPIEASIPGDISSPSFLVCAPALFKDA